MSSEGLAHFFETMLPFIEGRTTAAHVIDALGATPSGEERLALYQTLVARQRRDVLAGLFPAVRAACGLIDAGFWDLVVREYTIAHPPRHWEPNHFGASLSEFLAARRQRHEKSHEKSDSATPAYLEELADYYWTRFQVGVTDLAADDDGVGMNRTLFVRHYTHDVLAYVQSVADRAKVTAEPPAAVATTLVLCWSRTEHKVFVLRASMATLVVIGRRLGQDPLAGKVVPGLTEELLDRAARDLVEWGVVARV